jgi:hypothetical protein
MYDPQENGVPDAIEGLHLTSSPTDIVKHLMREVRDSPDNTVGFDRDEAYLLARLERGARLELHDE